MPTPWRPLPVLALWIVSGLGLSAVTGRVRDWFDMTDELRYERLAISIARTHSLVPRIHGVDVRSFSQLYPLLVAPVFAHGLVPHDVVQAHVLNAWVMSSACIPAYLLARRVGLRRPLAYVIAALSVFMPWIVYSTMLMTEVAAYPAFVWALLALHYATVHRSGRGDLIALLGLALAFFGRTELLALVFVAPIAIVAFEIGRRDEEASARRAVAGVRSAVRGHRLLTAAYAVLLAGGIVLSKEGKLSAIVGVYGTNGVYGTFAHPGTLFSPRLPGPFTAHVALFSLGFGLLPFLVGTAWLLANVVRPRVRREQHAFACLAAVTLLVVLLQVTEFDLNNAGSFHVQERYLLYLVPAIVIAMGCAVSSPHRPRWAMLAPVAVTVCGFAMGVFPAFTWQQSATLDTDSPMSGLLRPIVRTTHTLTEARVLLATATIVLGLLFVAGTVWLSRCALAVAVTVFAAIALPGITVATFAHLLRPPGWSGRSLTAPEGGTHDWIDRAVGPTGSVTVVPYLISSDYFVSEQSFRDLEFWNKSVVRDALGPNGDAYAYTGAWFPKIHLAFDPKTGHATVSPTRWVVVSDKDTRFQLAGSVRLEVGDLQLSEPDEPWRAQWMSFGLYDDGWTRPGVTARIRIFPERGQRRAQMRRFAFAVRAPDDVARRPVRIVSDIDRWSGVTSAATMTGSIAVCVPAHGYTEIRLATPVSSTIPADLSTPDQPDRSRRGGVFFGETALAGEVGGACRTRT